MGTVSVSLPSDGQTIDAADYNTPINTIVTAVNGNLDSDNIAEGGVVPNSLTDGTGTSWTWQSWTPTYTSITVGNGTVTAKYIQIGKTVHFRFRILCGSTTALADGILISLPITASSEYGSTNTSDPIGKCTASDSSALRYPGDAVISGTDRDNLQLFFLTETTTRYTSTFPFTEAVNDALVVTGTYEAA